MIKGRAIEVGHDKEVRVGFSMSVPEAILLKVIMSNIGGNGPGRQLADGIVKVLNQLEIHSLYDRGYSSSALIDSPMRLQDAGTSSRAGLMEALNKVTTISLNTIILDKDVTDGK